MELIDINYLYSAGLVTDTVESGDTFLLGRPNSQRGDKYSILAIDEADLVSYIASKIPTPPPSGGDRVESGTFTLSADGSTATGGVVAPLGGGVFTFTVTTTKKLKLLNDIKASVDPRYTPIIAPTFPSFPASVNGISDGTVQSCFDTYACRIDNSNCLSVLDSANGNGWTAQLTSTTDTTMVFTFTQIGAGLDITIGKWIATTGS